MKNKIKYENKLAPYIIPIILCVYHYSFYFLPEVSLSYFLIILWIFYMFFMSIKCNAKINLFPLIFVFILFIISIVGLSYNSKGSIFLFLVDLFKIFSWVLVFVFLNGGYINFEKLTKNMLLISIIASIFLIVQILAYVLFNFKISNYTNLYILIPTTVDMQTTIQYRPASFFAEPAYYARYILMTIVLLSFNNKNKLVSKYLGITIFLSTSTGGIILYLIYILLRNIKLKKLMFIVLTIVMIFVINIYIDELMNVFGNTKIIYGILIQIKKIDYIGTSSRFGKSFSLIKNLTNMSLYFGLGFGNEYSILPNKTYMNFITRIIFQTGILGLLTLLTFIVGNIVKIKNKHSLYIIFLIVVLMFTANVGLNATGVFIWSLLYSIEMEYKK